jgi:hypothetical protein
VAGPDTASLEPVLFAIGVSDYLLGLNFREGVVAGAFFKIHIQTSWFRVDQNLEKTNCCDGLMPTEPDEVAMKQFEPAFLAASMTFCVRVIGVEEKGGPSFGTPEVPKLGTHPSPSKVDNNDKTGRFVRGHDWLIRRREGRCLSRG